LLVGREADGDEVDLDGWADDVWALPLPAMRAGPGNG